MELPFEKQMTETEITGVCVCTEARNHPFTHHYDVGNDLTPKQACSTHITG